MSFIRFINSITKNSKKEVEKIVSLFPEPFLTVSLQLTLTVTVGYC